MPDISSALFALLQTTHSSPFKNSAVRNKCSRDRVADKTPPYSSVSLTVFNADPDSVDYWISYNSLDHFDGRLTLKAKDFKT